MKTVLETVRQYEAAWIYCLLYESREKGVLKKQGIGMAGLAVILYIINYLHGEIQQGSVLDFKIAQFSFFFRISLDSLKQNFQEKGALNNQPANFKVNGDTYCPPPSHFNCKIQCCWQRVVIFTSKRFSVSIL